MCSVRLRRGKLWHAQIVIVWNHPRESWNKSRGSQRGARAARVLDSEADKVRMRVAIAADIAGGQNLANASAIETSSRLQHVSALIVIHYAEPCCIGDRWGCRHEIRLWKRKQAGPLWIIFSLVKIA